jgi:recombination protein RecT
MCEKTAINKVCKYVINSSDDKSIVARFAREMDNELQEAAVEAEIEANANKEILDIEPEYEVVDEPQTAAETPPANEPEGQATQVSMEGPGY